MNRDSPTVLALDIGTSSVRAILFDQNGDKIGAVGQIEYAQTTSQDGGIETDAQQLLERVALCIDDVLKNHCAPIIAVAISCFWHSLMAIDSSGNALTPLFSWADNRAAPWISVLRATLDEDETHARTGCVFHTSYWPAKLLWLHHTQPQLFDSSTRLKTKWIGFGEYLALKWCETARVSLSSASGSGVFHQNKCDWDDETLAALPIERENLFALCDADEPLENLRGELQNRWPQLRAAKWFPALGDGACSNVGSGCTTPDKIALNVGTSGALRVVLENYEAAAPTGLWRYRIDRKRVLLGGALSNGGSVYAWAHKTFGFPDDAETQIADLKPDSHGLTILPFLAGERSPLWNANARFALEGASLDTTSVEILQACLEASSLRFASVAQLLFVAIENDVAITNAPNAFAPNALAANVADSNVAVSNDLAANVAAANVAAANVAAANVAAANVSQSSIRKPLQIVASGGALSHSPAWTKIMCDCLGENLSLSQEAEASARGAALMALESLGIVEDVAELSSECGETFQPDAQHHAIYESALLRQNALYQKLYGEMK